MKYTLAVLIMAIVVLALIGPNLAMATVYSSSPSSIVVSAPANLVSSAWLAVERVVGVVIDFFTPPPPPPKKKDPPPKPSTENTTWGEIKARFK